MKLNYSEICMRVEGKTHKYIEVQVLNALNNHSHFGIKTSLFVRTITMYFFINYAMENVQGSLQIQFHSNSKMFLKWELLRNKTQVSF